MSAGNVTLHCPVSALYAFFPLISVLPQFETVLPHIHGLRLSYCFL